MHISWIGANNLPPLEYLSLECDEQVNLFIGPNASGKSTILRAINGLYSLSPVPSEESKERSSYAYEPGDRPTRFYIDASRDTPQEIASMPTLWDAVPFLYIPATRVSLPGMHIFSETIDKEQNVESVAPLKDLLDTGSGIFYGQYAELVMARTRELITNRSQQDQFRKALRRGYSCSRSICREVIYDDVPHHFIELDSGDNEIFSPERIVHYDMGIGTNDDVLGEPLYAGSLSSGTQGTLLWIWALAINILNHYRWTEGWEDKPAILLIDEIENHLHPTWQRRVIPALLKHFPKLQIFATTHSPFVVAGLKAGQVHLLNRDANGVVTATTNEQDVIGWTADEILRTMMGVDDPTDDDTAKAAAELRELRRELPKADEKEEELRQQRIQELRQRVDRDLLAGGPAAAQRELFEQQFAEALEKYRQSQGLNQDNG